MRTALIIIPALALLGASPALQENRGAQIEVGARIQAPRILAIRTHHDMCPYCKQLKPKFEELGARVIDESVLLVTLDLSTPATQQQTALMVGALGLESIWTGDLSRIGTVTFLETKSKKSLAEYRADGDKSLEAVMRQVLQTQREEP